MGEKQYMLRCLQLAKNGLGLVAPNPMVGCVIVHDQIIVGEGFHQIFGGAHAEVNAINSVKNKSLLKDSTLYVSLEPCCHFGKTPPCANLIVKYKIPKVVIATRDPNPLVAGKGIKLLTNAGIEVMENTCGSEALFLNRRFIKHQVKRRPYVILKWAQSADGFMDRDRINNAEQKINWISHPRTKKLVHLWRSQEQAILVGKNTIINDNPRLNTREVDGKSPLRIVLCGNGEIPDNSNVLIDGGDTLVFNEHKTAIDGSTQWIKADKNDLNLVLTKLAENGISSVLIEGGSAILSAFIDQKLWDEARIIQSELILGAGKPAPKIELKISQAKMYDSDRITTFFRQ